MSSKVVSAARWSAKTEVMAKLVALVSSMVSVRLFTLEAFGVVATLTMPIMFADFVNFVNGYVYISLLLWLLLSNIAHESLV